MRALIMAKSAGTKPGFQALMMRALRLPDPQHLYLLAQGSIILNGRRPLQEAPRVRRVQKAFRVDNGLRGPAAGRAQQEARAAAAAAASQQQLRSEADVRALMEVSHPQSPVLSDCTVLTNSEDATPVRQLF